MRLNHDKIEQARDIFGEIHLTKCPIFREEAEKTLALLMKIEPFSYKGKEEFTRRVVVEYWAYYESLETQLNAYPQLSRKVVFESWFVDKATDPDHIQRAVRWLTSPEPKGGGYIILDKDVAERAKNYSNSIRERVGSK